MKIYEDRTYIEMCARADELQGQAAAGLSAPWEFGAPPDGILFVPDKPYPTDIPTRVWLPHIEDILAMLDAPVLYILEELFEWCNRAGYRAYTRETVEQMSMAQTALAFLMHIKYNKIWDGARWIDGPRESLCFNPVSP